jgi:hypothetical protein
LVLTSRSRARVEALGSVPGLGERRAWWIRIIRSSGGRERGDDAAAAFGFGMG